MVSGLTSHCRWGKRCMLAVANDPIYILEQNLRGAVHTVLDDVIALLGAGTVTSSCRWGMNWVMPHSAVFQRTFLKNF